MIRNELHSFDENNLPEYSITIFHPTQVGPNMLISNLIIYAIFNCIRSSFVLLYPLLNNLENFIALVTKLKFLFDFVPFLLFFFCIFFSFFLDCVVYIDSKKYNGDMLHVHFGLNVDNNELVKYVILRNECKHT